MITVLTASYNGRNYIRQQLDSILEQDRGDIGVLVSDDCSFDGSPKLLESFCREHEGRALVMHRSYPSGGAAAHFLKLLKLMADHRRGREGELEKDLWEYKGLEEKDRSLLGELARAEYFMLSDQDDVWLPHKARRLAEKMEEVEAGLQKDGAFLPPVLIHSDLRVTDRQLETIAPSFFQYQKISPERTRLAQLLVQNNVTGGAVMINRGMLSFLERIPDECLMHDSWLALLASAFGRIDFVKEPLYCYRQHSGNVLGAKKGDSLEGIESRIKDGSAARENYRKMFAQAESLLRMYEDRLNAGQRETLEKFIQLPGRSRLEKMFLILRYGFTKNTWMRTLGQMFFMSV